MDRVKKLIHTDGAYKSGLSGQGITVAVMDTGACVHSLACGFAQNVI